MVNTARGEVCLGIGGVERKLCLTLGALAEIETALGARGLSDLSERLRQPSADELLQVLLALLRGGGECVSADALRTAPLDLRAAMQAIGAAFRAASEGPPEAESNTPGKL